MRNQQHTINFDAMDMAAREACSAVCEGFALSFPILNSQARTTTILFSPPERRTSLSSCQAVILDRTATLTRLEQKLQRDEATLEELRASSKRGYLHLRTEGAMLGLLLTRTMKQKK